MAGVRSTRLAIAVISALVLSAGFAQTAAADSYAGALVSYYMDSTGA